MARPTIAYTYDTGQLELGVSGVIPLYQRVQQHNKSQAMKHEDLKLAHSRSMPIMPYASGMLHTSASLAATVTAGAASSSKGAGTGPQQIFRKGKGPPRTDKPKPLMCMIPQTVGRPMNVNVSLSNKKKKEIKKHISTKVTLPAHLARTMGDFMYSGAPVTVPGGGFQKHARNKSPVLSSLASSPKL